MTNRNRRMPARRSSGRRRTGRNVWVNQNLNEVLLDNGTVLFPILDAAEEFMKFDVTIKAVILPNFSNQWTIGIPHEYQMRAALLVAHEGLDASDLTDLPFADSVGPPWLGVLGHSSFRDGGSHDIQLSGGGNPIIQFRAQRRLRENNSTLFMMVQTVVSSATVANQISGMARTLLHIP